MIRVIFKTTFLIICFVTAAHAILKQQYGGNIKVAGELLEGTKSQTISDFGLAYEIQDDALSMDLQFLNSDHLTEIEKHTNDMNDISDPCHWILDYPYLDHSHHTIMKVDGRQLVLEAENAGTLQTILNSACLFSGKLDFLQAFRPTQFAYEANPDALSGRPFLDSITPVQIDPLNPYLSFKLNDVDVIPIPEDRFSQVSGDPQVRVVNGPRVLLYLETAGISGEQVSALLSEIDAQELSKAVLNDHTEILLQRQPEDRPAMDFAFSFVNPADSHYRLIGERIKLQVKATNNERASVTLSAAPLQGPNLDLAAYQILRNRLQSKEPWQPVWQQLVDEGKIVPLLIHVTQIAVRTNMLDLRWRPDGSLDFSNAWIPNRP